MANIDNEEMVVGVATMAFDEQTSGQVVVQWLSILVLTLLSGLFSGLTLGLLSLDTNGLQVRRCALFLFSLSLA